jgi:hypothetical protein
VTFQQYLTEVSVMLARHPEYRYGQACFNTLHNVRPDISERLRSTSVDPFYDDQIAGEFLLAVYDLWES